MSYNKDFRLIGKSYWNEKVHPMGSTPDYKAKRKHIDPEGYKKFLKKAGLNPHVHTKIQLKKMTKTGLIRLVIKLEKFIVNHAYEMYKAKLPRLRTTKKALPRIPYGKSVKIRAAPLELSRRQVLKKGRWTTKPKRKKLTGAAKAKFLARMNKGRRKKGIKPIRSR